LSIYEAFVHSGAHHACKVNIKKINSDDLENDNNLISSVFEGVDGILVAPGFGQRGFEGKIAAVKFARENQIPFLGICFGMQVACVEFARNVCGLEGANSTEIDKETPYPIIDLMREQKNIMVMGGSMRLGAYPCDLEEGSLALKVYQQSTIFERHRHRYEFNNDCRSILEKNGMSFSGINMRENLVEIVEIPSHRWFIGVQFHPEYQSTIEDGHPLFLSFVGECCKK
jgi:CTP synthase